MTDGLARATAVHCLRQLAERVEEESEIYHELHDLADQVETPRPLAPVFELVTQEER